MKTVTINVTQEDIEAGEVSSCRSCPIALAAARALNRGVYVDNRCIRYDELGPRVANLSATAREFIREFDDEETVAPFSFDIEVAE